MRFNTLPIHAEDVVESPPAALLASLLKFMKRET